jgi:hypothetical protein
MSIAPRRTTSSRASRPVVGLDCEICAGLAARTIPISRLAVQPLQPRLLFSQRPSAIAIAIGTGPPSLTLLACAPAASDATATITLQSLANWSYLRRTMGACQLPTQSRLVDGKRRHASVGSQRHNHRLRSNRNGSAGRPDARRASRPCDVCAAHRRAANASSSLLTTNPIAGRHHPAQPSTLEDIGDDAAASDARATAAARSPGRADARYRRVPDHGAGWALADREDRLAACAHS